MVVDQSRKIFHESWYRIANQKIALRSTVRIHRQFYRGSLWYVLYEPFTNQFFRFREHAYQFIARLSLKKSIEEIWLELLKEYPESAPGQSDIIKLLSSLYQANMLHYHQSEDGTQLFERHSKKKNKKIKSSLLNIFFLRIPLVDPYPLLKSLNSLIKIIVSKPMFLLWGMVIFLGLKVGIENFDALKDNAQGFLAPENLIWIYVCTVLIKIIHEFGHSFIVHRYGGEVHTLGIMFMLLAPLPYMDATASWAFRKKRHRILVGSGGIIFELFIAAIALIVWVNVGGGPIKSIAYNVFFIASISTLLFNANPLMRFDGYYILTDVLDMPNLQQQSKLHLKYVLERFLFKKQDAIQVTKAFNEACLYSVYGVASSIYRIILFTGIIITISKHFLILSVIMGITLILSMVITPCFKFIKYIFSSAELSRVRARAISLTLIFFGSISAFLFYFPVSDTFTAPGVLEAFRYEDVITKTNGQVIEITSSTGAFIDSGATLLILENPVLENQILEKRAALVESQFNYKKALYSSPENMYPIFKRIEVLTQELQRLENEKEDLALKAPMSGIWISENLADLPSKWILKGDSLGTLIDSSRFLFKAVIPQNEAARLFGVTGKNVKIRLNGNAFTELLVKEFKIIPIAQNELPSMALGWHGGGNIEVVSTASNQTTEPFYLVEALLYPSSSVRFMQGRSGKIRFVSGKLPLARQGIRKIRQALQKYYRI